jgi:hypothetical protein
MKKTSATSHTAGPADGLGEEYRFVEIGDRPRFPKTEIGVRSLRRAPWVQFRGQYPS